MKSHFILFTLLLILLPHSSYGQSKCNCIENFDWMVKTFSENDAGFQYVVDKKGVEDYNTFTAKLRQQVEKASTNEECWQIMNQWLRYFRRLHIGLRLNVPTVSQGTSEVATKSKDEITVFDMSEEELIQILKKKPNANPIEGVWSSAEYKIGIVANDDSTYTAFIIESVNKFYQPKDIKARIVKDKGDKYRHTYYMGKERNEYKGQTYFYGNDKEGLNLSGVMWKRLYPTYEYPSLTELEFKGHEAKKPFLEKINDKTVYIRIPSFVAGAKKNIDKMLEMNDALIKSTPVLIIDIRNGTGGSDSSFGGLLPYIYTNPYRTGGIEIWATDENIKGYEYYAKMFEQMGNSQSARQMTEMAKKLKKNAGEYVQIPFRNRVMNKSLASPKRVGIIVNERNGSTDEQFLLEAKQSQKVKVFGHPTSGCLDISNMNSVKSPDGKFTLGYAMSRKIDIYTYAIDGVGIQPDFFIDSSISMFDWIRYTQEILEASLEP